MERSIFGFIWKFSARDQVILLAVTVMLFPLLYATLELPKQIINGAIDAESPEITVWGMTFGQVEYLFILCGFFLLAVLAHGLLKMRINTMKGVLAERLLRRFRYTLIARILRFPQPYFERTSQGELVSMVTAESEPMGGLMGDALAQPVLQAGQMLTILGFLFAQSVTFGLAACALIPLQAWLIPMLQRQINKLNKKRVLQVRALAAEIGESASGASTLRVNAGWRYHLARVTDRLGHLFEIRFEIYQKKFFMKFLNNFITQLTPFLFYAIGGYLVIQGDVTLGALVAALAAYKDLASPWKELLAYYNQSQDMSLRWETIIERFQPAGMVDEDLLNATPDEIPRLTGDITLSNATVRDSDGNTMLDDIDTALPGGVLIGVEIADDEDRAAFAALLTRELMPSSGAIRIADHALAELPQAVLAARVGHATARPVLFQGSFEDNLMMSIRHAPQGDGTDEGFAHEADRAGNSADMLSAPWIDPARAGVSDQAELRARWSHLTEAIGAADALLRRALEHPLMPDQHPELAAKIVSLRPAIAETLAMLYLDKHVFSFDPDTYCPALPAVQNLLYALPRNDDSLDILLNHKDYIELVGDAELEQDLLDLSLSVMDGLGRIFGAVGIDHPLFAKTGLSEELYEAALKAAAEQRAEKPLDEIGQAALMSVAGNISAEQMGPAFPDSLRERVLSLRQTHGARLREQLSEIFEPIDPNKPVIGLSVMENLIFGKLSEDAGPQGEEVRKAISDVLRKEGAWNSVLELALEIPIALGGANLPPAFAEPLAITRAAIKRPDILLLDEPMASFDTDTRARMVSALRDDLPEATLIYLASELPEGVAFDRQLEIKQGRLASDEGDVSHEGEGDMADDLTRKMKALQQSSLFSGLDRRQLRLLAFGARWYNASDASYVFYKNDPPDSGAFMITQGEADLLLPQDEDEDQLIATVGIGTLVGELGLIRSEPRALDMRAKGELQCLRIGVEEFLAVVENDAATAFKLLQVVAGYVRT